MSENVRMKARYYNKHVTIAKTAVLSLQNRTPFASEQCLLIFFTFSHI